jgi:hypothetical protein
MAMQKSPKIGLALGSGASRGWSHVGVIDALIAEGIEPDVICGTSVGAMVGASYLAGNLAKLKDWASGQIHQQFRCRQGCRDRSAAQTFSCRCNLSQHGPGGLVAQR